MGKASEKLPLAFRPPASYVIMVLTYIGSCVLGRFADVPTAPGAALTLASWVASIIYGGWKASRGLSLRPAIAWAFAALLLATIGQYLAGSEPLKGGRPYQGHLVYLASLATLATMISVLGARTPGAGAWSILMGLLVVVLLIPWLETFGLRGKVAALDRLRLEFPWWLFFALLMLAGVTNYLPTWNGGPAALVGLALAGELAALMNVDWPADRRASLWGAFFWAVALAEIAIWAGRRHRPAGEPGLPALWLWFRDTWGVVWALRVRERFNRTAEAAGWPIRLAWEGVVPAEPGGPIVIPPEAEPTLKGLLRRFATPERLDLAARGVSPLQACPDANSSGQ